MQDPLALVQLFDADALHDAAPGHHLLLEGGGDPGRGVDREVAAEPGMAAEAAAPQQRWRPDRAGGDDHHWRRDPQLASLGAAAFDPVARPRSLSTRVTLQARDDPGPGLAGLRQGR